MVDHDESVNPNADFWNEFKSLHNETKMIDSTKVLPLPILSNMTNILTSSFHSMNNNSRCCNNDNISTYGNNENIHNHFSHNSINNRVLASDEKGAGHFETS